MIKRIIGYIITIAILVVVVLVAINAGSYKSLLPDTLFSSSAVEAVGNQEQKEQKEHQATAADPSQEGSDVAEDK